MTDKPDLSKLNAVTAPIALVTPNVPISMAGQMMNVNLAPVGSVQSTQQNVAPLGSYLVNACWGPNGWQECAQGTPGSRQALKTPNGKILPY